MKKRLIFAAIAAFTAAIAIFYIYSLNENTGIPCIFYLLTGYYCSGCGATRAFRSILHLDFYKALRFNSLFTIIFPFALIYFISVFISYIVTGSDRVSRKIPKSIPILLILIAIIFGIIRNIPQFSFLSPQIT